MNCLFQLMIKPQLLCLILLLSETAGFVFAQKPNLPSSAVLVDQFSRHQHYTVEQGLSNNWVSSIAQDDDGFLWFGTQEGLNRFDGERFTQFFQEGPGQGLPDEHIAQLLALPQHRLLIGTEKGLCLFHTRSLKFELIPLPSHPSWPKIEQGIWELQRDRQGQIWVGTSAGIFVLNAQFKVLRQYFNPAASPLTAHPIFVLDFLELPDGTMVVKLAHSSTAYSSTWQIIDFQNNRTISLAKHRPAYGVLDSARVQDCVVAEGQKALWYTTLGTKNRVGLYRFDVKKQRSQIVLKAPAPALQDLRIGQFSRPFLLSDSLLLLQPYFGALHLYNLRNGDLMELPKWKTSWPDGKNILYFLDRDGNLWLCPRFEGVYFLNLTKLAATPMLALNAAHQKMMAHSGVPEEWFRFISTAQGNRWVLSSGNGGLYSMEKNERGVIGKIADNPFNSYAYARSFAHDRGDTLWMTALDALYWYYPPNNTYGRLQTHLRGLALLDNRFLYRDSRGLIWGRVRDNGVCCFDTRSRQFSHFPSQGPKAPYPILSASVCVEDPAGDLWFAFGSEEKYLVRWRRSSGVFEKIKPISPPGFKCAGAVNLLADPYGYLWLNAERRWFRMNMKTLQTEVFGKKNGLSTNNPAAICLDKEGKLWFATAFGLSRYDPLSKRMRTFYTTDGLLSNVILNVELLDTVQNILFVSTDRGMGLFEPNRVAPELGLHPAFITGLRVSDQAMLLPESGFLGLPHHKNDLRIEFTGINFTQGATNRYQYSMEPEGKPADWKDAGTDNFANFLNLSPSRYRFQVRTANRDGAWGQATAHLNIFIYPPWWNTWTFRLSFVAALVLAIGWFYRRQISKAESREAEKAKVRQQMADLEMRALRSQMNPHFIFNALNSVQNFILKNDPREASRYLTKFARLMRLILENSESPMVALAREIELLQYYTELEAVRFKQRFQFDFQIDPRLNTESVAIPGMLIQPHIENAIWHGLMHREGQGQLWVRFGLETEQTLVCEIEDNGLGRARAAEIEQEYKQGGHRSTGLINIRHRLELLNEQLGKDISMEIIDLYDSNQQAVGTKVRVRMPILAHPPFATATKISNSHESHSH